jgi:hypothetical protein
MLGCSTYVCKKKKGDRGKGAVRKLRIYTLSAQVSTPHASIHLLEQREACKQTKRRRLEVCFT